MGKRFMKLEHVFFQEIDNEGILLNLASGRYLRLNATATQIWKLLDESPLSRDAIRDRLAFEYDAEPDEIVQDIYDVLNEMVSLGLVELT